MEIIFENKLYFLKEIIICDNIEKGCYSICWDGEDEEKNEYHIYTICSKSYPTSPKEIEVVETVHINNFLEWNLN